MSKGGGRSGGGGHGGGSGHGHGEAATAQNAAETLSGLLASHSRLLWGHSVSEHIVPSAGLVQVLDGGEQRHLWSTKDANAEAERTLVSTARSVTGMLVLVALVGGCAFTCASHLQVSQSYGKVTTMEEG